MNDWTAAPVLTGRHVELVPLGEQHTAGLLAAADADEVFDWLAFARPTDLDDAAAIAAHYRGASGAAWVQTVAGTGEVAGLTTFYDVDPELRTVAIGWTWLGRRFWRSGLNTEAKLLLLTRAFDDLGCVRVVWHVDIRNTRSQAAVERLGAVREGVLRKHKRRRDGSWRDTVTFAMLDDEWPAARAALQQRLAR